MNKKIIKKEISVVHFLFLTTSKLLIGIGIGIILATKIFFVQPYWYLAILLGVLILVPTMMKLMKEEGLEEIKLKKQLKK